MQINGNYKSVSHFSFFAALKFTHWSSKAEGYTSAPNSKLLQTEKFGNLTYLWCLEGFPYADRVIVHVMKTEVEPQQTGFLFLNCTCLGGASVISKSGSFHCSQNKNWVTTWYINAHNGHDQQHLQSEVTLKCLADVITAWLQTTSPKYYLLPPFSQSLFLELICQFFLEGLWKYLESQAFLSQTVQCILW